jgi:hypothetical protein
MPIIFTICSNNYLAQATVLGNSIRVQHPTYRFIICLVDEKNEKIPYDTIGHELIPVAEIEPDLKKLVIKYDIVELNTCIKPRVFEYLFSSSNADKIIYLDPDTRVFGPFNELEKRLEQFSVVLTPHIYSPIPMDGHSPQEKLFLKFGIYNLGFIAVSRGEESLKLISWWKNWTYHLGFGQSGGVFLDQLPLNHAPIFFKDVLVLQHTGYNMAPWNLHERYLSEKEGRYLVNEKTPLIFYHFSSFRVDSGELPVHNYTRFTMKERPDLLHIHQAYNNELKTAGYFFYSAIPCQYVLEREKYLQNAKTEKWKSRGLHKKIALWILRSNAFKKLGNLISIHNSNQGSL